MTGRQRVLQLNERGFDIPMIAAVLDATLETVEEALLGEDISIGGGGEGFEEAHVFSDEHHNILIGTEPEEFEGFFVTTLGVNAGSNLTTASDATFIGAYAGHENQTGVENTFIGAYAGEHNEEGAHNTFVGEAAGNSVLTSENVMVGNMAGLNAGKDPASLFNTYIGFRAGSNNEAGGQNTYVGFEAGGGGANNTPNEEQANTFIGCFAGHDTTSGFFNTFVGSKTGASNTTGKGNTAIGEEAGFANLEGSDNAWLGAEAGSHMVSGDKNTLVGSHAGLRRASGDENVIVGYDAGNAKEATGSKNIIIGTGAVQPNVPQTGDLNIIIGYGAAANITSAARCIVIGPEAGNELVAEEDVLWIDSGLNNSEEAVEDPLIRGKLSSSGSPSLNLLSGDGQLRFFDNAGGIGRQELASDPTPAEIATVLGNFGLVTLT